MAERRGSPDEELLRKYPEGSEDSGIADKLRKARERLFGKKEKGLVIGFDGRIYPEGQFDQMKPAEKRGVCVGSTCIHYESDVPGMSDTD